MEKRLKEGWVSGGELAKVGSGSRIECEEGEEQEEGRMKEGEGGRCFTSMSPRRRISMGATASSSSKPVARMHRAVFFPPPGHHGRNFSVSSAGQGLKQHTPLCHLRFPLTRHTERLRHGGRAVLGGR